MKSNIHGPPWILFYFAFAAILALSSTASAIGGVGSGGSPSLIGAGSGGYSAIGTGCADHYSTPSLGLEMISYTTYHPNGDGYIANPTDHQPFSVATAEVVAPCDIVASSSADTETGNKWPPLHQATPGGVATRSTEPGISLNP
jgi:hypothetical protein